MKAMRYISVFLGSLLILGMWNLGCHKKEEAIPAEEAAPPAEEAAPVSEEEGAPPAEERECVAKALLLDGSARDLGETKPTPVSATIQLKFDKDVATEDQSKVQDDFQLIKSEGEVVIEGTFAWSDAKTMVFKPNNFLDEKTVYEVKYKGESLDKIRTPTSNDVNGDGKADTVLLSGTSAYLILGKSELQNMDLNNWDGTKITGFEITGEVAPVLGDFNADGYSDFLLEKDKIIYLFMGKESFEKNLQLDSRDVQVNFPAAEGFGYIWSITTGDLDKDGYADLVVNRNETANRSQIYIVSGKDLDGEVNVSLDALIPAGEGHPGYSSIAVGDINGDGQLDIVAGAPSYTMNKGSFFIFYGPDFTDINTKVGESAGDRFGTLVASCDVNGDGKDDVIATAPYRDSSKGSVYVYYKESALSLGYKLDGIQPGEGFSSALAVIGDVNKDGKCDFVVGSPNYESQGEVLGKAIILKGKADWSLDQVRLSHEIVGYIHFGQWASTMGDFTGNGDLEFMVRVNVYNSDNKKIFIYSGDVGAQDSPKAAIENVTFLEV